jgi:basic membrane protein A and related proteins
VRERQWLPWLALALVFVLALVGAGCGGGKKKSSGTTTSGGGGGGKKITVALVSDVGHFNDKSFNESQLDGLNKSKADLGITAIPLQSNSASDYLPNLTQAIRRKSDLIISAGYLLAPATATVAKKYPNKSFAITDYPVEAAPFANKKGKVLFKNVEGLTYAANEGGCLVGVLAAKMAKKEGSNVIGAVGGIKIPPVDIWIAGYKFCAEKAVPGIKVVIGYSQDFVASDKCKTVAQNLIGQGAKVLFQVAGLCGLGTLRAADDAGIWGIGVDKDQYNDAKRVLTSGVKRVDVGVQDAIKSVQEGKFKGGADLLFNLKNNGMSVGKINPAVPKAFITEMNSYKQKIIAGTLKVPSAL